MSADATRLGKTAKEKLISLLVLSLELQLIVGTHWKLAGKRFNL